jgi:ricin-type beta-trefoil lectin protein
MMGRLVRLRRDDTGSMPFALLLILIATSLSALLTPMVITQLHSTRAETQRVQALEAARAGLDVALGQIRRANDGTGTGDPTELPCTVKGSVGGDPGTGASYTVTITYYIVTDAGVTQGSCPLAANTPVDHADLSSIGKARARRTVTATYKFWTTTENILGGLIPAYPTAGVPDLCMDAGSAHPTAGTPLLMQPCTAGSAQQSFAYNPDLTLMLVSSATSSLGAMCLDAGSPHALGNPVTLQKCGTSGSPAARQIWSLNNHANFEGTSDGTTNDNFCFNVKNPGIAGSPVILGSGDKVLTGNKPTCQQQHDDKEAFSPYPSVGAGAAGPSTGQLVNYSQFGRCLDVPHASPTYAFMIVWPCKQAPDPSTIKWNEKWAAVTSPLHTDRMLLTTTDDSADRWCLQRPVSSQYATLVSCPTSGGGVTTDDEWLMTGDNHNAVTENRIEWVDPSTGATTCLSPNDATVDPYVDMPAKVTADMQISKVITVPCDGSGLRKWNVTTGKSLSLPLTAMGEK